MTFYEGFDINEFGNFLNLINLKLISINFKFQIVNLELKFEIDLDSYKMNS